MKFTAASGRGIAKEFIIVVDMDLPPELASRPAGLRSSRSLRPVGAIGPTPRWEITEELIFLFLCLRVLAAKLLRLAT